MSKLKWPVFAALWVFVALASITDVLGKTSPVAKSFKVKKGGNLVVDIDNIGADIHVKVWSKLEVAVRAEGIHDNDLEYLEINKNGNTVRVDIAVGNGWGSHRKARFYINVPSEFDLDIGTSGGSVDVAGSVEGTVDVATAGGNIEVDDVVGDISLRTAGGGITVGNVDGDAGLSTAGGDVRVGDVTGNLGVGTAGGDIIIGEVKKDLGAGTAGGDIRCEKVGGEAGVETSGGDIELGVVKGGVTARTSGGNIEILGATGKAVAKTSGGDIELANIVGHVEAATAGGDISVELNPTNAATSSIETKGGEITFYLPANAKATVEAQIRLRDWDRHGRDEYDIYSDFEAEERDRSDREVWARYVINGGGKIITIETVNGNIEIRKQ
jgi:DUF4097 and DUF4098 domain-containing protein YvlB